MILKSRLRVSKGHSKAVSYSLFVATMAVSLAVCEILSVKEGRDLEKLG